MEIEKLSKLIESTYGKKDISLNVYNSIIKECVYHKEMEAVVYIYDQIINSGHKPDELTFKLVNKLHSKTIPESNKIHIKYQNSAKRLAPRRRIHKIMKGHNYSDKYNNAKEHEEKVRKFLDENPNYKSQVDKRIKLAKIISKKCNISFNDARFVITALKRKKFFSDKTSHSQQSITKFFGKKE
jgi:pentatricopeptide repeat protein